jgi:hypothetical protein
MLAYVNDVLHPHGFDHIGSDNFAALRQILAQVSQFLTENEIAKDLLF